MIITDLIDAVADEIRDAVVNLKLPQEHHGSNDLTLKPVTVYEGFLPRDAFNDDSYYPLVLVEFMSTSDELNGANAKSTTTIGLSMGVFAAESWGWKDAMHLMTVVRHRLLTHRVVGKKFRLTDEVSWEVAPDQPSPFFYTYATLTYQTFQPTNH